MSLSKELTEIQTAVDARLAVFFDTKKREAGEITPDLLPVLSLAEEFVLGGGKRLRPFLVSLGYMIGKGSPDVDIIDACTAFECIHAFLLIQDDIMDQDTVRRGKPTLHHSYGKVHGDHSGEALAIIASDILREYGQELLMNTKVADSTKLKALTHLTTLIQEVSMGQMLDMLYAVPRSEPTRENILKVAEYKTARYSVEGPLVLGLILANSTFDLSKVQAVSRELGIAFQLQDDLLGITGDPTRSGKKLGADLREGKQTLLLLESFSHLSKPDQVTLKKLVGNSTATDKEVAQGLELIKESGAVEVVEKEIATRYSKALAMVSDMDLIPYTRTTLVELINYLMHRER